MASQMIGFNNQLNERDIQKLIQSNSIIEVARELGLAVSRSVVPCINKEKHVDSNGAPSMSFNLLNNTYKCWVCPDVGGTVIDLVQQVKNISRDKAVEFLSIRSKIKPGNGIKNVTTSSKKEAINDRDKEMIFQDFLSGIDKTKGIELLAFASTKGGTGKTMVVNNIAVIFSLITRYIGKHRNANSQNVEVIDLDFGKPDQRLLLGIEPDLYIEDLFYKSSHDGWDELRQKTPIDNLKLVSSCPIRKSNSLYYLKKNEILFMIHNSDALLKLADFGGGTDRDTLDFLNQLKSKVFVINPDKASVEAVFNLILSLIYYPLKQQFKNNADVSGLIEKFRNCRKTGFTIEDLKIGLNKIDLKRTKSNSIQSFYEETLIPFKKALGINGEVAVSADIDCLKTDLPMLKSLVNKLMFYDGNNITFNTKSKIYRTLNIIENKIINFTNFSEYLDDLLKSRMFGLIINKADKIEADPIADDFVKKIAKTFSMCMTYLGNIPEDKALRNISNYQMPFIIYNHNHPAMEGFYSIVDKIIGLKPGSTEKIIHEQAQYISSLKTNWLTDVENTSKVTYQA